MRVTTSARPVFTRISTNLGLVLSNLALAHTPTYHPGLSGTSTSFGQSPALSINSHIPPYRIEKGSATAPSTMDPPQCVQNAMMKQDKKPFTYTPGGINLNEIKSPRLGRRIELNANAPGVGEVPTSQAQHPGYPTGPLPPSALAAMRPQTQVQVFPGPPPPPPMMKNIPPPPPPPSCPLPTQKVTTGDNQVLERPDMTKIIPDNPMALLRKTGGPSPRTSFIEDMFAQEPKAPPQRAPPSPQQRAPQSPQQPQVEPPKPQPQPQQYQPPPQQPQQYQPPPQQPQQYQPQYQPQAAPEPPRPSYQPPVIERTPSLRNEQATQKSTAQLGSLYIPPINQQQQRVVSPPSPPERFDSQSPGTPTLKQAPKPWEAKKNKAQEELPPWAKRENQNGGEVQTQSPPAQQPPQQDRWQPQAQPAQQQQQQQPHMWQPQVKQALAQQQQQPQNKWQPQQQQQQPRSPPAQPNTIRINIVTNPNQQYAPEADGNRKPNAVYITQPVVLQHPGGGTPPPPFVQLKGQPQMRQQPNQPQQQRQRQQAAQPQVDAQGARIIPIQVEGRGAVTPQSPAGGNERSFNRQQSWTPPQSNSFKVIQKITQTDDDEDDDTPVTHHSARYPQNFQQPPPVEQMRKMKLQEGDRELMNRFKQELLGYDEENPRYRGGHIPSKVFRILDESGVDDESLQREEDPRYRGAAIPSKTFKILQNSLDGVAVSQQNNQQADQHGPKVRTIPVQIEGNGGPQKYVHPSEQIVPEPKKYTGGNIPSRSFKILQAMTAPETCANAEDNEDIPFPPYEQNYPYYYPPPPYWYPNYYYPGEQPVESKNKSGRTTPRATPVPFWGYAPQYPPSVSRRTSTVDGETDAETCSNPRATPLSFVGYPYPYPPAYPLGEQENDENYPQYPPYFDPYYYYHYGYPPTPTYPYYEYEDSGTDTEMAYYNRQSTSVVGGRRKSFDTGYSTTPSIIVTPTNEMSKKLNNIQNAAPNSQEEETETSESESDTETETEEAENPNQQFNGLRSIKSVNNINVYYDEDEGLVEEISEATTDDTDETSMAIDEEIIPHQLSVIFEESERTDSRIRSASVLSDSTTIAERSDDEIDEREEELFVEVTGNRNIKVYEEVVVVEEIQVQRKSPDHVEIVEEREESEEQQEEDKCEETEEEESDVDFWSILGTREVSEPIRTKENKVEEIGTRNEEKEADNGKLMEIENKVQIVEVPIEDEEEIKVELRKKTKHQQINQVSSIYDEIKSKDVDSRKLMEIENKIEVSKEEKEEYKVEFRKKRNRQPLNRVSSIYDELKDDVNEETDVDNGKLMEIESFADKLEEIKRNSGLWNFNLSDISDTNNETNGKVEETKVKEEIEEPVIKVDEKENRELQDEQKDDDGDDDSEEVDFWSAIKGEDSDEELRRRRESMKKTDAYSASSIECSSYGKSTKEKEVAFVELKAEEIEESDEETFETAEIEEIEKETQRFSANVKEEKCECINVACAENIAVNIAEIIEDSVEYCTAEESSVSEEKAQTSNSNDLNNNKDEEPTALSIKDRIKALKDSIEEKKRKLEEKEEIKVCVKDRICAIEMTSENRSKTLSTKSSIKSFEEYSEEEGDSGVISDLSRHISDTEEFPELKKLTRYQRAATHSRLFKLLQDECDDDDDEEEETKIVQEDKFSKLSVRQRSKSKDRSPCRSQLSLPLKKCTETTESSLSSSGITSPGSPVNDKLANELVLSLLKRKKGQAFRNVPKEKILDAAKRILQEESEIMDSPSDCASFLSPLRGDTQMSTPAQTPQEFYGTHNEYKQYYESWKEAEQFYDENYDILPSKAFKLLQEHSGANRIGMIEGLIAKCPRILSSKNVHRELMKLLDEDPGCSSSDPENASLNQNEVTNTS